MLTSRRARGCLAAVLAAPLLMGQAPAAGTDALRDGFADPPPAARPWVWWHWMNGNVSIEGARLDLEWMKRAGIGGVQLFEGDLATPVLVDRRLVWMSPEWRAALRASVATANRLGLGFAIATSPGWSISGAPFVQPADAMKKLVWRETHVRGGTPVGRLPGPPAIAGPFADIAGDSPGKLGPFYRDVAVLAFPDTTPALPVPRVTGSAGTLDAGLLADGAFGRGVTLPFEAGKSEAWVLYDYGRPVTIRSATVGLPGAHGFGAPPAADATLEGSDDGTRFGPIATLPATGAQLRSASFAPITARFVRLRLVTREAAAPPIAPGVAPPVFGPPPPRSVALSEFVVHAEGRVHRAEEKAGFAAADDYHALATPPTSVGRPVPPAKVLDLTTRLKPDGSLAWTPPPGRWTVLRLGYSLTGHRNGPAPAEATGLEVDKLDPAAVRRYIDTYLDRYAAAAGPGVTALLSDSIESGAQNWTPGMLDAFRRLRGYDATPWLPALTGTVIGSAERSDRFLWDFRKTIADLLASAHYGTIATAAKTRGLTYYAEALEDHRPQLGDDLAMRAAADVPMGAMWTIPPGGAPRQTFVADLQGAASVAHLAGKPIVAAESLTTFGAPWAYAPRDLKATVDLEFALGVNRIVIHTSPHQPFEDRAPGMALAPFLGQYFSRTETWGEMARPWTDYLARSSFLLQQGRPVADIAYFIGEDAPVTGLFGETPVDVPAGFGFDFVGADALAAQLSVDAGGAIRSTGGARYALLMLGGSSRYMTLATLRRLRDLARGGATIVGARPLGSPSLADDDRAVRSIIDDLWGDGAGKPRVHANLTQALAALKLDRDWRATRIADGDLAVLHRRLVDGELWFVANRAGRAIAGDLSLRTTGRAPELWHADTGRVEPASYRMADGRTTVPLAMAKDEAVFVVLRGSTPVGARTVPPPRLRTLVGLSGPWRLGFPGERDAPAARTLAALSSWSNAADPALRYHSGIGTYRSDLSVPAGWLKPERRLLLDLGEVREVAEVRVNGTLAGTAWKAPFRIDVTGLVRSGRNTVEVRVANLWVNRLIGDAQPGAVTKAFTTGATYRADAPLKRSGLLGPVRLIGEDGADR